MRLTLCNRPSGVYIPHSIGPRSIDPLKDVKVQLPNNNTRSMKRGTKQSYREKYSIHLFHPRKWVWTSNQECTVMTTEVWDNLFYPPPKKQDTYEGRYQHETALLFGKGARRVERERKKREGAHRCRKHEKNILKASQLHVIPKHIWPGEKKSPWQNATKKALQCLPGSFILRVLGSCLKHLVDTFTWHIARPFTPGTRWGTGRLHIHAWTGSVVLWQEYSWVAVSALYAPTQCNSFW